MPTSDVSKSRPGVALHVEQRLGNPERRTLRARPRAGVERPALGRRGRAAPRARPHGGRASTSGVTAAPTRPDGGYDLDTAVADLLALIARAGPRAAGARRPIVGRQRRAGARLAPAGRRARHRVRRRRRHRAGRVVSLVGGLPDRADPAATRSPHAGRARGPDPKAQLPHFTETRHRARTCTASARAPTAPSSLGCSASPAPRRSCDRSGSTAPRRAGATLEDARRCCCSPTPATPRGPRPSVRRRPPRSPRRPRIRSLWFSPGHHDLHLEFPERVTDLLAGAVRDGLLRAERANAAAPRRSWAPGRPHPPW